MIQTIDTILEASPYQSYVYAYPHKTAYRPIEPPISLQETWAEDDKSALFLYLHIPFCEMRCGFCNLFTTVNPANSLDTAYLNQLEVQAERTRMALGEARFARMAIGGGTPTYLLPDQLERLFGIAEHMGVNLAQIPISVETSPLTATPDRLAVLRDHAVDRISIGVQSFFEDEVRGAGRSQKTADVHRALSQIRASGIPTLNIDLIYGLPHQTLESWRESILMALEYSPEELYLYPLYVRPLTGLDKRGEPDDYHDIRLACYRAGRDLLREHGYEQMSMRMFRAAHAPKRNGVIYCCQEDGMVGIGCGARSYTRHYHYSTDYAVGRRGVLDILQSYVNRLPASFDVVDYGFYLNHDEQRRRYLLKSLLHGTGLSPLMYEAYLGSDVWKDFPALLTLVEAGLVTRDVDILYLSESGLELSDAIGPYFYSDRVNVLMEAFSLR